MQSPAAPCTDIWTAFDSLPSRDIVAGSSLVTVSMLFPVTPVCVLALPLK